MLIRRVFQFLHMLTLGFLAMGMPNPTYAQNAAGGESDSASGDSKSASKPPKVRQRVTLKLPDEYRSKDKDKDGQIGMYEWSRTDYATFRKLDLNSDGFITPLELSRAGRSKRSAYADSGRTSSTSSSNGLVSTSASAAPAAATTVDAPAETASDTPTASRSEAERQFEVIDKDRDGKITEGEFQKSFLAKKKFEKAGIALSFPVGREEFLRAYPASK
jgi:hypothetical protein